MTFGKEGSKKNRKHKLRITEILSRSHQQISMQQRQ